MTEPKRKEKEVVVDENGKIIRALIEMGEDIEKLDQWLPLPQNSCCVVFGEKKSPLPLGAIRILWENCPEAIWKCEHCGGRVYADGMGGLLVVGGFSGVCIDCNLRGHNSIGGLGIVMNFIKPYFENSDFPIKGAIFGGASKGIKKPMYEALKELGVKGLPDESWLEQTEETIVSLTIKKPEKKESKDESN
ncbi:MAG: hypothetical protein RBS89_07255 [Candidatus Delongbacteria bacterium]|jgi:hypothetical protein|nr:hypothetical protein [Candidatus Delongbacteria bacterium]